MACLDWSAIESAELAQDPFPHVAIRRVLTARCAQLLPEEYPAIRSPGSFSLADAPPGPVLGDLISELQSDRFRSEMARIFGLDLEGKPVVVTLRGQCSPRDGRIHTDSRSKVLSLLLYLNADWSSPAGQLRLLRNGNDIEAVGAQIPPTLGSFVAFPRLDNSWHGHTAFVGQRRVLQLNYLRSERASLVGELRHRLSALTKLRVA